MTGVEACIIIILLCHRGAVNWPVDRVYGITTYPYVQYSRQSATTQAMKLRSPNNSVQKILENRVW